MSQVRSRVVTRGTARHRIRKTTTAVKRICQSVELDEQSFIHITIAVKLLLRIVAPKIFGDICATGEELCTEVLSRSRTVDDYLQVLRKTRHQGSNDPGFYTVHLRHVVFRALSRGGLTAFMKKLKAERERDAES